MDVRDLRTILTKAGFPCKDPQDQYSDSNNTDAGPRLIEAVKAFQAKYRLAQDGKVGPATLNALYLHTSYRLNMRCGAAGQLIIRKFEGLPPTKDGHYVPYICPAGYATIGRGHAICDRHGRYITLSNNGHDVSTTLKEAAAAIEHQYGTPYIDQDQVEALFEMDLNLFSGRLWSHFANDHIPAQQNEFDAFVSTSFNIGLNAFLGSSILLCHKRSLDDDPDLHEVLDISDLASHSQHNSPIENVAEAFCAWSHISGVWTLGLFRRRYVEACLYYTPTGADNIISYVKSDISTAYNFTD
jgi:GH24 family phage-related lysozyme (muramidase)